MPTHSIPAHTVCTDVSKRRPYTRVIVIALVATLVLASCGTTAPSEAAQAQLALAATAAAASPAVASATRIPSVASVTHTSLNNASTTPTVLRATDVPSATAAPSAAATTTRAPDNATPSPLTTGAQTTPTHIAAIATAMLATATTVPPTTTRAPRATDTPPSATVALPSATAPLPTATVLLPSATAPLPTATAALPSATALLPTATAAEVAAADNGQPVPISFTELYAGASITGPILSEKAKALNGRMVVMEGYMAPPLMPNVDFFVLTRTPMVYCPFCSSAADWPFDIVFVRMASGHTLPPTVPTQGIRVIGIFSIGTATDAATGFVSQVRISAEQVDILQ